MSSGPVSSGDPKAEYRALRPSARALSTTHPHVFYWIAAVEVVALAIVGCVLMSRSVAGGIAIIATGVVIGAMTAWPAHWSERHPDEARNAVRVQRNVRNRMAQRHPAYFLVVVPLVLAVDAGLRFNANHRHHSTLSWVIPTAVGLIIGLALGIVLVQRARRAPRL